MAKRRSPAPEQGDLFSATETARQAATEKTAPAPAVVQSGRVAAANVAVAASPLMPLANAPVAPAPLADAPVAVAFAPPSNTSSSAPPAPTTTAASSVLASAASPALRAGHGADLVAAGALPLIAPSPGGPLPIPAVQSPPPAIVATRAVERKVFSVSELTRQIKGTLERNFTRVLVRGEVSNFRGANARGHLYFSLKDADAQLDTKIWASFASRMKFKLREGLSVVVEGHIDLFEPQGRYSLIVDKIDPEGEGALALAFQQLKERLTAEGLMGDKRARPLRPIPFLPRRIGVVTSKTGAALQDFLRVLHSRHPRLSVLVADARVQGEGSAAEVVRAIERLSRTDCDVIVVTRGGGSLEDLWTFNEEAVARAIFACPKPVVSAIGHEIDFTISDFVADYRAPTPSAAAEKLAPVLKELQLALATWQRRLHKGAERKLLVDRSRLSLLREKLVDPRRLLDGRRLELSENAEALSEAMRKALRAREVRLRQLTERLSRQRPEARLAQNRAKLTELKTRLSKALNASLARRHETLRRARLTIERRNPTASLRQARGVLQKLRLSLNSQAKAKLARDTHALERAMQKLDALSPLKVMRRGYAVTFTPDGHVLRRASDVKSGDEIRVRLLPPNAPNEATLSEADEVVAKVK